MLVTNKYSHIPVQNYLQLHVNLNPEYESHLFKHMLFNVVVRNYDYHAENIGLIIDTEKFPLMIYDIAKNQITNG